MRRAPAIVAACLAMLAANIPPVALGQAPEKVADVTRFATGRSFVYHEVGFGQPSLPEPIESNIEVHHTDVLEAGDTGYITIKWLGSGELTIESGQVHLLDDEDGAPLARFKGELGLVRVEDALPGYTLVTPHASFVDWGTTFEVLTEARESRVYVYEGIVAVTSTDPRFPEVVLVQAGEWARAREGEPISAPKVFILSRARFDPGSGASDCVYSNCKVIDDPRIPEQPVYTPGVLIPPPPNPPGRR